MKRWKISVIFLLLALSIYPQSVYQLKDISREHWAFRSIENLYEKGILIFDEEIFRGEKNINRFEMAYFLSRTLDRIDNDKANRDDLLILEYIVYEFSEELAKFGFESKNYLDRLLVIEKELDENRLKNEKNIEVIENLNQRIRDLERSSLVRRTGFLDVNSNQSDRMKYLEDFSLYLHSGIDYLSGSSSGDTNNYKGYYNLGVSFKQDNFELILESSTSDNERKRGELTVKGQLEANVYRDYYLTFHTTDYERYMRSHFNHVIYDNHNSFSYIEGNRRYQYDYFDSYGISLRDENIGLYIEKTRTDYDNVYETAEGIGVDRDFTDTFNFILEINFPYFEGIVLRNANNSNQDIEFLLRYPIGKIELIGGLAQKKGKNRRVVGMSNKDAQDPKYRFDKLNIINGELVYGGKSNLTLGVEIKIENVILYNSYYGSFNYQLTDTGSLKYKFEYIDSFNDTYNNHYILLNITGDQLTTYIGYNKIETDRRYLVSEGSTSDPYGTESNYTETLIKAEYKFNPETTARFGHLIRDYTDTGFDNDNQKKITFMEVSYEFSSAIRGYVQYTANSGKNDFNDRRLDINNNMIDLDFNSNTGAIRSAEKGRYLLGIEIEF